MTIRVLLKVLIVVLFALPVAIWGVRLVTGRYPSPAFAVVVTAAIVAAVVATDALYGW
jgi:hypothetical protein